MRRKRLDRNRFDGLPIGKPGARIRDPKYLKAMHSMPCLIPDCTNRPVDPHHWPKTVGAGGSDYDTIPLCREHHTQAHAGQISYDDMAALAPFFPERHSIFTLSIAA